MTQFDRRRFLTLAAGTLGVAGLGFTAACSGDDAEGPGGSASGGSLTWWDHTTGNEELLAPIFKAYTADTGINVEYTYYQAAKMAQTLQLARTSEELPDIHTIAGLEMPLSQLVADGWFQPLQLSDKADSSIPQESKVEGINVFDGKLYGFATTGSKFFNANTWFNRELIEQAGLDPEQPPGTFADFRAACKKVQSGTKAKGLILNTGATLNMVIDNLAQSAGFEGASGTLFRTGEIQWHADPYVEVLEFLQSVHQDKYVVEGQFTSDTARPRWMVGQAAFMIDGIWIPGAVKAESAPFLDKVGVGAPLTPGADQEGLMYRPTGGGTYFLSQQSSQPKEAGALMEQLLTDEYQLGVARGMAQPPLNLDLLEDAEVHESFRKPLQLAAERCFTTPQLVRKSPEAAQAVAGVPKAKPGMLEIVQGLISGDVTDIRGTLKKLSDSSAAGRDKALKKAGLSVDDMAFPNWKPEQDFTEDMYG